MQGFGGDFTFVTPSVGFMLSYDSAGKNLGIARTLDGGATWTFISPRLAAK
jgi:hypothetical protein